jgi:hypothetical protein
MPHHLSTMKNDVLERVRLKLQRHGAGAAAHQLAMKALNHALLFKILRGVVIERPAAEFLPYPKRYGAGILDEATLRELSRDPGNEMSPEFLDHAFARGDQCYGFLDEGRLAAYGWYSSAPTPVGIDDLVLQFSPSYVYMYKGFTHPDCRGQRLHAIGMTRALQHYLGKGFKGLVSYVESTNFDSLKSCFRMGYAPFGSVYVARAFGRAAAWSGPGCARFAFGLARSAGASAQPSLGKS